MGIELEANFCLVLNPIPRDTRREIIGACLPDKLAEEGEYNFTKKGHRVFYMDGPIPLHRKVDGNVYEPIGLVQILDIQHTKFREQKITRGKYKFVKKKGEGELVVFTSEGFEVREV